MGHVRAWLLIAHQFTRRTRCRLNAHDTGRLEERGVVVRHGSSIRQRGGVESRPVHQRLKQTCHENATKHEKSPFELSFLASADSCPSRLLGRFNIRNLLRMSYILCLILCLMICSISYILSYDISYGLCLIVCVLFA